MSRLLALLRRPLAVLALCVAARASAATLGADQLLLWRGAHRSGSDVAEFFVRGATPGEQIFWVVTTERSVQAAQLMADPRKSAIADASGGAYFQIPAPEVPELAAGGEPTTFYVSAFALRDGANAVFSDFVLLRDLPALFLLVEGNDAAARILSFDPRDRRLGDALGHDLDPSAALAAVGSTAIVERDQGLLPLDGSAATGFGAGEEPIDLAVTADQSAAMVLTRELLPAGRALLRLRLLDAGNLPHEIGSLEVLRGSSRLVAARLVTADDSHRVLLVADGDGLIREVTLGVEPVRGVTFLPLAADGSEELVDVRVADDWLVAVTRTIPGRPARGPDSRLLLLDLRTRADPIEISLPARAVDVEVGTSKGRAAAFVALVDDRIEVIPLQDAGTTSSTLLLPGPAALTRSPLSHRLYVASTVARLRQSRLFELDADALTLTPLKIAPFSGAITSFGIVDATDRQWLYLVERLVEDQLWCCELDPASGRPLERPSRHPLGGHVRRVAAR